MRSDLVASSLIEISGSSLTVEILTDELALEALMPEWSALEAAVTPRMPFRTPGWNRLWWKHFAARNWKVSEQLCIYVLREAGGRLVAVAPMMLTCRPGRFLHLFRELQFLGADPNITELRGPVCRPGDELRMIEALADEFARHRRRWHWLHWSGLALNRGAQAAVEQGGPVDWGEPIEDFCLSLPKSWDEFRAGRSRNIKESLRKCYNSLKRDGHAYTFRVVTEASETPAALDCFFDLHARRSQLAGTIEHPDVFAAPRARAFLADYCLLAAQQHSLRVFQLQIAGTVVATRIGFQQGDELFMYYSGFLPEWGPYSVMTTTVAEALRWAIDHQIRLVNLSTGDDVSKARWGPSGVRYMQGLQVANGWGSRLRFALYGLLTQYSRQESFLGRVLRRVRRSV